MKTRKDLIKMIRRLQTSISIILFSMVFIFCWRVTDFKITEIQLSEWGESGQTAWIWNSIVIFLSFSILFNSIIYISNNTRIKYKTISYLLFIFISMCLFSVGFFDINEQPIHNIAAWLYFFSYPLVIFIFTHIHRKHLQYSDWLKDILISISMILLPLLFIWLYDGMAIAETIHIILVMMWNLKIALND
jgi:hypothetical membrane protein